jgi:thioesterase domain-containing protein
MTSLPFDSFSLQTMNTNTPDYRTTTAKDRMIRRLSEIAWAENLGLANKTHALLNNVIVPLTQPDPNTRAIPPIYFVHEIGGTVAMYFDIIGAFGPQQPCFGIQATSEMRTVEYAKSISIESLAERYVGELMRFQPTGALALVGWCAGAIIALQMAQQLKKLGRKDILLANIDGELFNTGGVISRRNPIYYLRLLQNFPAWLIYNESGRNKFIKYFKTRALRAISIGKNAPSVQKEKTPERALAIAAFGDVSAKMLASDEAEHRRNMYYDFIEEGRPRLPEGRQAFVGALYRAMFEYQPQPYSGRVVVYKSQVGALLYLYQVASAWRAISSRAEIVTIRGAHHTTMIKDPAVTELVKDFEGRRAQMGLSTLACFRA